MMRIGFMVIASAALLLCVACKDDRAEETVSNKANQEQGGENEQEGEGPQWPPPGEKAPPPPGVKEAMSLMANAFNSGHADKVRSCRPRDPGAGLRFGGSHWLRPGARRAL